MPMYEWKCRSCHLRRSVFRELAERDWPPGNGTCGCMNSLWVRCYDSVGFKRVMQEHFNHSTGTPISDERQFGHKLRELSDKAEDRLGIPHDYQPVDLTDKDSLGVTDMPE